MKKLIQTFRFFYIKKSGNALSLFILFVGIFLLPGIALASNITAEKLFELTNKERKENGLDALAANQLLAQAAHNKADDILKFQTFQHNINERKFSSWIREAGYNYSYVGENLALDFMTSEGVLKAWLESPAHKKNLIDPNFAEMGIAAVEGEFDGKKTTVAVQIFGTQPSSAAALIAPRSNPIFKNNFNLGALSDESLLTHSAGNLAIESENISLSDEQLKPNKFFIHSEQKDFYFQFNNYHFSFLAIIIFSGFYISYFYKYSSSIRIR